MDVQIEMHFAHFEILGVIVQPWVQLRNMFVNFKKLGRWHLLKHHYPQVNTVQVKSLLQCARVWPNIQTHLFVIEHRNWTSPPQFYVEFPQKICLYNLMKFNWHMNENQLIFEEPYIRQFGALRKSCQWRSFAKHLYRWNPMSSSWLG